MYACVHHADQRRAVRRGLHHPSGRRGEDLRGDAPRHRDAVRGVAARHGRGHVGVARGGARGVRRRGRGTGRRRHQAHRFDVPVARRGAGRELPQDDGRDGHGHPGHPDQAGRPPAQHAHDRGGAQAEADREGPRDARHLRARSPTGSVSTRSSGSSRTSRSRRCTRASTTRSRGWWPSSAPSASATSTRPASTCQRSSTSWRSKRRSRAAPSTSTRSTRR